MLPVVTHSKRSVAAFKKRKCNVLRVQKKNVAFSIFAKTRRRFGNGHSMLRTVALWKPRSARSAGVRHEVRADVRVHVFTVAILAQGTNRGDALCAALLCNRAVSILADVVFLVLLAKRARVRDGVRPAVSFP